MRNIWRHDVVRTCMFCGCTFVYEDPLICYPVMSQHPEEYPEIPTIRGTCPECYYIMKPHKERSAHNL